MYRLYADMLSTRYQEAQQDSARQPQIPVRPTTLSPFYYTTIRRLGGYLVRIGHKLEGVNLQKERYSIRSL
jgi:hypothetical protein